MKLKTVYDNLGSRTRLTSLVILVLFVFSAVLIPIVAADHYNEQIRKLRTENQQTQSLVDELAAEAKILEDAIDKMQKQIEALQAQIVANRDKSAKLKADIVVAEKELERQKDVLGQNIKAMYLEGQITTLEMLATSKDLSQFVDKQQYRDVVKSKIKAQVDEITTLRLELQSQRDEVERLIIEDEKLRREVASQQAERNRLLNLNQAEQAEYNRKIAENQEKIQDLKQQQFLENVRRFGGGDGVIGGGGYPWGHAPCLSGGQVDGWCYDYEWGYDDNWRNWATGGYAYRNCTDWVAWRISQDGKTVPPGMGNATMWDNRAPSFGFQVTYTPTKGAAAVQNTTIKPEWEGYGHLMYVEAVHEDGTITISDYNRAGTGKYAISRIDPRGLVFVIF